MQIDILFSDIDMVVLGVPSDLNGQMSLLQLADRLAEKGETNMHIIPTAKVGSLLGAVASPILAERAAPARFPSSS